MFKKILIANRGEIACRVIKTARKMGIQTVALYSDADAEALHVKMADEAVHIGPPPASQSYIVIDKVMDAIRQTGAELILHGHDHIAQSATIEGPKGPIPSIGATSASGPQREDLKAGGYALHDVTASDDRYVLTSIHRGFNEEGEIVDKDHLRFEISP